MITFDLVEIFESLQGEGRNTGRPAVFVRFAGCNLSCPWCDTDVGRRFTLGLDDLVSEILSFKPRSVILTGGEPLLQKWLADLVAALKNHGRWVAVETNGTIDSAVLGFVDYIACSPKAEYPDRIAIKSANEVRVVASSPEAAGFCRLVKGKIEADDYYVSPCDRDGRIDFATAKETLSLLEGWSLSVQLHKILGFR